MESTSSSLPGMAQHAVLLMPIHFIDGNCVIAVACRTGLTYQTWCISHHIMLPVINSLRGGDTHTHTHTHIYAHILMHEPKQFQETRHLAATGHRAL